MMESNKVKGDFSGNLFWHSYYFRIRINRLFNNLINLICKIRGVKIEKKINFLGLPVIRRYPNSNIFLGQGSYFNSARNSVLEGLVKPCRFITLNGNAEIIIGRNVGASGTTFVAASKVSIGNNVLIGAHTSIVDTDFHSADPNIRLKHDVMPSRPVIIEDNVFIGYNCLILKGVTIGENSVIGANSVVFNSIPKNSIAVGNPCKVVIRKSWQAKQ
jgi:acetyltransferase-like isoleucine patch superfamily enzyme